MQGARAGGPIMSPVQHGFDGSDDFAELLLKSCRQIPEAIGRA